MCNFNQKHDKNIFAIRPCFWRYTDLTKYEPCIFTDTELVFNENPALKTEKCENLQTFIKLEVIITRWVLVIEEWNFYYFTCPKRCWEVVSKYKLPQAQYKALKSITFGKLVPKLFRQYNLNSYCILNTFVVHIVYVSLTS